MERLQRNSLSASSPPTRIRRMCAVASIVLVLAGCSSSGVEIDYSGPNRSAAYACAELALNGSLRDEDGTPGSIRVTDITVTDRASVADFSTYGVLGTTRTTGGPDPASYAWECDVEVRIGGDDVGRLTATLRSFQRAE